MTATLKITLPDDLAEKVKAKVASGAYADESEVIREGLLALEDRHTTFEQWLREEVAPTYDQFEADPSQGIPADEVFDNALNRYQARKAARNSSAE